MIISDNRTVVPKGEFKKNSKEKGKKSLIKRIDFHSKFVQNLDKEHPLYLFLIFYDTYNKRETYNFTHYVACFLL